MRTEEQNAPIIDVGAVSEAVNVPLGEPTARTQVV